MLELYLCPLPTNEHPARLSPTPIVITRFPCVLGRHARCDERIDDLMISRRHCRFVLRDDWAWVEDLGSRNGTLLNGERVSRALPVADGDILQVGDLGFQVGLQNSPMASRVSPLPATAPAGVHLVGSDGPVACDVAG